MPWNICNNRISVQLIITMKTKEQRNKRGKIGYSTFDNTIEIPMKYGVTRRFCPSSNSTSRYSNLYYTAELADTFHICSDKKNIGQAGRQTEKNGDASLYLGELGGRGKIMC